jgi:membrane protein DedA with SNARE-associated domain
MDEFIVTYGYLALALGILLEGEAALLAASFAANRGYMVISLVILTAFLITLSLDWGYFFLGRFKGRAFLMKRPQLLKKVEKVHHWIERNPRGLMSGFRFIYGFRMVIPLIMGTTQVNTRQFMILSAISTFVWAIAFGLAGYFLSSFMEENMALLSQYKLPIIAFLAGGGFIFFLMRYLKSRTTAI